MAKFSLIPFQKNQLKIDLVCTTTLSEDSFYIGYQLTQDLASIDMGVYTPHKSRCLNLWEKTCFELFLKNTNGHYIEFNFSPNFEWNAFYFEKLRGPLKELEMAQVPVLDILNSSDKFSLVAKIPLSSLPVEFQNNIANCDLGITTVIKDRKGEISYWALTHKDSKPNFHHYDSFIGKF